LLYIYLLSV